MYIFKYCICIKKFKEKIIHYFHLLKKNKRQKIHIFEYDYDYKREYNIIEEYKLLPKKICFEYYEFCLERGFLPNPEQMLTFIINLPRDDHNPMD